MAASGLVVMMNGLPGALGMASAQACLSRGMVLAPVAMAGSSNGECEVTHGDQTVSVRLISSQDPSKQRAAIAELQEKHGSKLIIVDCTLPKAVNPNAELYTSLKCPFVMGTTGGDREKLLKDTEDSGTYAVIAPNMCKQIVAFQATMDHMAKTFPGAFGGYKLELVESHQSTKADTSGTAKALVSSLNGLGVEPPFTVDNIQKIRDPEEQKSRIGVPEEALGGHAWHTYTLTSPDQSVQFQFKHNVCGRQTYGEGVADAVQFLAAKVAASSEKRIFTMIDVLSEGAMK